MISLNKSAIRPIASIYSVMAFDASIPPTAAIHSFAAPNDGNQSTNRCNMKLMLTHDECCWLSPRDLQDATASDLAN